MKHQTIIQLKHKLKALNLPTSGKKQVLIERLTCYNRVVLLQKCVRGWFVRNYVKLKGPALKYNNRKLCVNAVDFLTLEDISTVHSSQFVSFTDGNFVYGFDMLSLHTLFETSKTMLSVKNPFNQTVFPPHVSSTLLQLMRLSKLLSIEINVTLPHVTLNESQQVEMQAVRLFHHMDSLGNYTNSNWFMSLSDVELTHFIRELIDIWEYRSMITPDVKCAICPPHGNPFIHLPSTFRNMSLNDIRMSVLKVINNMVCKGTDNGNQSLGAIFVLSCLTLFNAEAAEALPWLHESAAANL